MVGSGRFWPVMGGRGRGIEAEEPLGRWSQPVELRLSRVEDTS